MKKLNYLVLGLAALTMASCSQEDMKFGTSNGDGNFNITVKLPGDMATRALGDGYASINLKYAVYDVTSGSPVYSFQDVAYFDLTSLTTNVSLNLIDGKKYQIAFFACSPDAESVYTFSPDATTPVISVNYEAMTGAADLADAYDCFFKLTDTYTVGTDVTPKEVLLTRPVAQINWGTNDIDGNGELTDVYGAAGKYIQTNMTVTGTVYTQFNILDQNVAAGSYQTVTLFGTDQCEVPTDTDFPVDPETYQYVACQYILVPTTSSNYSLTLNINNGANGGTGDQNKAIQVDNAPVQANYRTNIYGTLLSANASFEVTKEPIFAGEYNIAQAWDGVSTTAPKVEGTTVSINLPSDLAGLAAMLNGEMDLPEGVPSDFKGYTVELNSNFDMDGNDFPMIGSAQRSGSGLNATTYKPFRGTFNGNGHTIQNVSIEYTGNDGSTSVGFIPNLDGEGVLQNVTFENVEINGGQAEQAGIVGIVSNGATVSGVHVTSGSVTSAEAAGGIVGRVLISGTIDNCSNGATVSSTKHNVGGIVGAAYYTKDANSVMTIKDCENTGTIKGLYGVGGIAGLSCANVSDCTNSGSVTGTQSSVGGVIGEQKATGTISGCTNTGNVTVTDGSGTNQYGCGGVIGWVRYATSGESTAYPYQSEIVVTGNKNLSNVIEGNSGVGGIVGMWYCAGTCKQNYNSATSITARTNFSAGIIGGSQWTESANYPSTLGNDAMLVVTNNESTTDSANINGSCAATIIYVNNTEQTSVSDNSPENQNITH